MAHKLVWLANPDWAVWLILAGILLIYAECNRPGTVALGCAGTLAAMLGIWGLDHGTVAAAGFGFVVAGIGLVGLGCVSRLWGPISAVGAACVGWGLMRLTLPPVHLATAVPVAAIFAGVTTWLGRVALLARQKKQIPGPWDRDSDGFTPIRTGCKE